MARAPGKDRALHEGLTHQGLASHLTRATTCVHDPMSYRRYFWLAERTFTPAKVQTVPKDQIRKPDKFQAPPLDYKVYKVLVRLQIWAYYPKD